MHYHALLAQTTIIPDIIVANLYNLIRKYASALLWLTSATPRDGYIVRPYLYRYASIVTCLKYSPVLNDLDSIRRATEKYVALRLINKFDRHNAIGFHVEFRFPDACDIPTAQAALKALFEAIILKGVELSEFGIMSADHPSGDWEKNKAMCRKIEEGIQLSEEEKDYLRQKARELIDFVKNQLLRRDGVCIRILCELAEQPISQRTQRDKTIQKHFARYITPKKENEITQKIRQSIILQTIKAKNIGEWKQIIAQQTGKSISLINQALGKLRETRAVEFDSELQTVIMR